MKRLPGLLASLALLTLTGCHYYVIEDTRTNQRYLTSGLLNDMAGPGIRFKDELSGETVQLPAYKLEIISKEAFKDAKRNGVAP